MNCNFIVAVIFEKINYSCTEEQQCKVKLGNEYHRSLGLGEVSESLVGFCRAEISFGIITVICTVVGFSQSPRSLIVLIDYAN